MTSSPYAREALAELEKVALRLVALKSAPNLSQAASQLGMAAVSLSRWLYRQPWAASYLDNPGEGDDVADDDR